MVARPRLSRKLLLPHRRRDGRYLGLSLELLKNAQRAAKVLPRPPGIALTAVSVVSPAQQVGSLRRLVCLPQRVGVRLRVPELLKGSRGHICSELQHGFGALGRQDGRHAIELRAQLLSA